MAIQNEIDSQDSALQTALQETDDHTPRSATLARAKMNADIQKIITSYQVTGSKECALEIGTSVDSLGYILGEKPSPVSINNAKLEKVHQKCCQRIVKYGHRKKKTKTLINSKFLKTLSYQGFPQKSRYELYDQIIGHRTHLSAYPDFYPILLEHAYETSMFIKQIDADVNRTLRRHHLFKDRYSANQAKLFNVLTAYSVFNPEVGYCQGMNVIAAILLLYLFEETSVFWALHCFICGEKYRHKGFLVPGFPRCYVLEKHFTDLLKMKLPEVAKNFEAQFIPVSAFVFKWLILLFQEALPTQLCMRVFDLYALRGDIILVPFALAIVKAHRKILSSSPMELILDFFMQKLPKSTSTLQQEEKIFADFKGLFRYFKKRGLCLPKEENTPGPFDDTDAAVEKMLEEIEKQKAAKRAEPIEVRITDEIGEERARLDGEANGAATIQRATSTHSLRLDSSGKIADKIPGFATLTKIKGDTKEKLETGIKKSSDLTKALGLVFTSTPRKILDSANEKPQTGKLPNGQRTGSMELKVEISHHFPTFLPPEDNNNNSETVETVEAPKEDVENFEALGSENAPTESVEPMLEKETVEVEELEPSDSVEIFTPEETKKPKVTEDVRALEIASVEKIVSLIKSPLDLNPGVFSSLVLKKKTEAALRNFLKPPSHLGSPTCNILGLASPRHLGRTFSVNLTTNYSREIFSTQRFQPSQYVTGSAENLIICPSERSGKSLEQQLADILSENVFKSQASQFSANVNGLTKLVLTRLNSSPQPIA